MSASCVRRTRPIEGLGHYQGRGFARKARAAAELRQRPRVLGPARTVNAWRRPQLWQLLGTRAPACSGVGRERLPMLTRRRGRGSQDVRPRARRQLTRTCHRRHIGDPDAGDARCATRLRITLRISPGASCPAHLARVMARARSCHACRLRVCPVVEPIAAASPRRDRLRRLDRRDEPCTMRPELPHPASQLRDFSTAAEKLPWARPNGGPRPDRPGIDIHGRAALGCHRASP